MILGTNTLQITQTSYVDDLYNLLKNIRNNKKYLPTGCTNFFVFNSKYYAVSNGFLIYIINHATQQTIKMPCSGVILHVEFLEQEDKFNIYSLVNDSCIVCDEIQGYKWDRLQEQEHGVNINRRSFMYNYGQQIASINSSQNYMTFITKQGEVFLADKKDERCRTDMKIMRTLAQITTFAQYVESGIDIEQNIIDNLAEFTQEGTLMDVSVQENKNGTLSLFILLLSSTNPITFRIYEHIVDATTFVQTSCRIYDTISIHGCNSCYTSKIRVNTIADVVKYFDKRTKHSIIILSCQNGINNKVYVTYIEVDNNGVETKKHVILHYVQDRLRLGREIILDDEEESEFLLKHAIEVEHGRLILFTYSDIQDSDDLNYHYVIVDHNNNIITSNDVTLTPEEHTLLQVTVENKIEDETNDSGYASEEDELEEETSETGLSMLEGLEESIEGINETLNKQEMEEENDEQDEKEEDSLMNDIEEEDYDSESFLDN